MGLPKPVRAAATVWLGLQLLACWVTAFTLQCIFCAFSFPFVTKYQREAVCGQIFRRTNWFFMIFLNPLWNLKMQTSFPDIPKGQKFIVMMNHSSNSDSWFAIKAIWPYDCKWIAKGVLFKIPFGGWGLRLAGDIPVKFTKEKGGWGTEKGSVGKMMRDCKDLINDHAHPIAVYPEGVRNPKPEGGLGEFKDGFFMVAIDTGAWIVPVAMSGSEKAWPVHDWRFGLATCYLSHGKPIDPKGHDVESLKKAVFDSITEMRDNHPDRKKKQ